MHRRPRRQRLRRHRRRASARARSAARPTADAPCAAHTPAPPTLPTPASGSTAAGSSDPPAPPGPPRDSARPTHAATGATRRPRAATSLTAAPSSTAITARYRCSMTDNATNPNPGLPPKEHEADHGQRRQPRPDTRLSSTSRDRTHERERCREDLLYELKAAFGRGRLRAARFARRARRPTPRARRRAQRQPRRADPATRPRDVKCGHRGGRGRGARQPQRQIGRRGVTSRSERQLAGCGRPQAAVLAGACPAARSCVGAFSASRAPGSPGQSSSPPRNLADPTARRVA